MADFQPRAIVSDKALRPGLNGTGGSLAKFVAVTIDAAGGQDPPNVILPAAGAGIYGVVVSSSVRVNVDPDVGIEDTKIGDIQVEGRTPMLVGTGGLTIGDLVAVDVAGAAVTAATGDTVIGKALTTALATEFAEVELSAAVQTGISIP